MVRRGVIDNDNLIARRLAPHDLRPRSRSWLYRLVRRLLRSVAMREAHLPAKAGLLPLSLGIEVRGTISAAATTGWFWTGSGTLRGDAPGRGDAPRENVRAQVYPVVERHRFVMGVDQARLDEGRSSYRWSTAIFWPCSESGLDVRWRLLACPLATTAC